MRESSRPRCTFCGARVFRRRTLLGRHHAGTGVCRRCYAEWVLDGQLCAGCQRPVVEIDEVGVFIERESFGHEECGAEPFTATPSPLRLGVAAAGG